MASATDPRSCSGISLLSLTSLRDGDSSINALVLGHCSLVCSSTQRGPMKRLSPLHAAVGIKERKTPLSCWLCGGWIVRK